MNATQKLVGGALLLVALAGSGGFLGGRALGAAEKKSNFDADAAELTRTQKSIEASLGVAVGNLRDAAKATTVANSEATKEQREKAINEALKPVHEETLILMLQTHLLSVDAMADDSPEMIKPFLQAQVYDKHGVGAAEVEARREATGLGHGGLILGYLVARESGKTADQVFTLKNGKSWSEVFRATNVSASKIGGALKQ
jgi:hypothetical protein